MNRQLIFLFILVSILILPAVAAQATVSITPYPLAITAGNDISITINPGTEGIGPNIIIKNSTMTRPLGTMCDNESKCYNTKEFRFYIPTDWQGTYSVSYTEYVEEAGNIVGKAAKTDFTVYQKGAVLPEFIKKAMEKTAKAKENLVYIRKIGNNFLIPDENDDLFISNDLDVNEQLSSIFETNKNSSEEIGYGISKSYLKEILSIQSHGYIIEFKDKPVLVKETEIEKKVVLEKDKIKDMSIINPVKYIKKFQVSGMENDLETNMEDYRNDILAMHDSFKKNIDKKIGITGKAIDSKESKIRILSEYVNVFNGIALDISAKDVEKIKKMKEVKAVYKNKKVKATLKESVPLINADYAWEKGYTGKGITIAIIDTGIDYTHPDLGSCEKPYPAGNIIDYSLESPHPYENDYDNTWTITQPGFSKIAVHFKSLKTESCCDYVQILDSEGYFIEGYSGDKEDFWSPVVEGDTIKIRFYSDYSETDEGFVIDKISDGVFNGGIKECKKVIGGYDFVNKDDDPIDDQGHGTHCAGIAAGNGTLKGVAPDAKLLAYKVLNEYGSGSFNDVISGIERATDPNNDGDFSDHADVISLSLGGPGDPDDPVSMAVDNAVDSGVVAVIAAGNSGPESSTIGSPGTARKAITVGAIDKKYRELAYFSSRGPVIWNKGIITKPDIVAPGVSICSAQYDSAWDENKCIDDNHVAISGTSMATPHVAGAAALLLEAHPEWKPSDVKLVLASTANTSFSGYSYISSEYDLNDIGSGLIDLEKAINFDTSSMVYTSAMNMGIMNMEESTWTKKETITIENKRGIVQQDLKKEVQSFGDWELVHSCCNCPSNYDFKSCEIEGDGSIRRAVCSKFGVSDIRVECEKKAPEDWECGSACPEGWKWTGECESRSSSLWGTVPLVVLESFIFKNKPEFFSSSILSDIFNTAVNAINSVGTGIYNAYVSVRDGIGQGIEDLKHGNLLGFAAKIVDGVLGGIGDILSGVIKGIGDIAGGIFGDDVAKPFDDFAEGVDNFFGDAVIQGDEREHKKPVCYSESIPPDSSSVVYNIGISDFGNLNSPGINYNFLKDVIIQPNSVKSFDFVVNADTSIEENDYYGFIVLKSAVNEIKIPLWFKKTAPAAILNTDVTNSDIQIKINSFIDLESAVISIAMPDKTTAEIDMESINSKKWVKEFVVKQDGQYNLKITAKDILGNTLISYSSFFGDMTPPQVNAQFLSDGSRTDVFVNSNEDISRGWGRQKQLSDSYSDDYEYVGYGYPVPELKISGNDVYFIYNKINVSDIWDSTFELLARKQNMISNKLSNPEVIANNQQILSELNEELDRYVGNSVYWYNYPKAVVDSQGNIYVFFIYASNNGFTGVDRISFMKFDKSEGTWNSRKDIYSVDHCTANKTMCNSPAEYREYWCEYNSENAERNYTKSLRDLDVLIDKNDDIYLFWKETTGSVITEEDEQGNIISWRSNEDFFYKKIDSNGNTLAEAVQISAADSVPVRNYDIAINSEDNLYIFWSDMIQSGEWGKIISQQGYYRTLNSNGLFSQIYPVANQNANGFNLAMDSKDNLHVIYSEKSDYWLAYYGIFNFSNNSITKLREFNDLMRNWGYGNKIAVDNEGNVYLLYVSWYNGYPNLKYAFYDISQNSWTEAILLAPLNDIMDIDGISDLSFDSNNNIHTAFTPLNKVSGWFYGGTLDNLVYIQYKNSPILKIPKDGKTEILTLSKASDGKWYESFETTSSSVEIIAADKAGNTNSSLWNPITGMLISSH